MSYLNSVNPANKVDLESARAHIEQNILPLLPPDRQTKIVELGCGTGRYVHVLHTLGYKNTFGCDSDADSVRFGMESLGLSNSVVCKDLMAYVADSSPDFSDVVLLIDVIEHLSQETAMDLLRSLKSKLVNSGGVIIIQTPNAFSVFQPTYWGDCTHKHLYSRHSLQQLVVLCGFDQAEFKEIPIRIHGPVSLIRFLIWKLILHPAVLAFHYIAYGNNHGGIYSSNLLCKCGK